MAKKRKKRKVLYHIYLRFDPKPHLGSLSLQTHTKKPAYVHMYTCAHYLTIEGFKNFTFLLQL